jgi:hypothetical protein
VLPAASSDIAEKEHFGWIDNQAGTVLYGGGV